MHRRQSIIARWKLASSLLSHLLVKQVLKVTLVLVWRFYSHFLIVLASTERCRFRSVLFLTRHLGFNTLISEVVSTHPSCWKLIIPRFWPCHTVTGSFSAVFPLLEFLQLTARVLSLKLIIVLPTVSATRIAPIRSNVIFRFHRCLCFGILLLHLLASWLLSLILSQLLLE